MNKLYLNKAAQTFIRANWTKTVISDATTIGWVKIWSNGRSDVITEAETNKDYVTNKYIVAELESFLRKRLANYTPKMRTIAKKKPQPKKQETVLPTETVGGINPRSSAALISGIECNIAHLRDMGYNVKCVVQAPGKEL